MAKIEVEIKLSKRLQYELTRIKKEIKNVRKINRDLKRQNLKFTNNNKKLLNIIIEKNTAITELKLRVKTLLESCKPKKEILVEVHYSIARSTFEHTDNGVFILNDDGSESLIIKGFFRSNNWWENNRFAIEAKTIPEVKS